MCPNLQNNIWKYCMSLVIPYCSFNGHSQNALALLISGITCLFNNLSCLFPDLYLKHLKCLRWVEFGICFPLLLFFFLCVCLFVLTFFCWWWVGCSFFKKEKTFVWNLTSLLLSDKLLLNSISKNLALLKQRLVHFRIVDLKGLKFRIQNNLNS